MTELIRLNKVNKNNRVYTKDSFKEFPKEVDITLGEVGFDDLDSATILGKASNFKIEDNYLISDILLNDASFMKNYPTIKNSVSFVTAGYASVTKKDGVNYITNYSIERVSCIPITESSITYSLYDKIKLFFIKRKLNGRNN